MKLMLVRFGTAAAAALTLAHAGCGGGGGGSSGSSSAGSFSSRLLALMIKEFRQLSRDALTLRMIIMVPLMQTFFMKDLGERPAL